MVLCCGFCPREGGLASGPGFCSHELVLGCRATDGLTSVLGCATTACSRRSTETGPDQAAKQIDDRMHRIGPPSPLMLVSNKWVPENGHPGWGPEPRMVSEFNGEFVYVV